MGMANTNHLQLIAGASHLDRRLSRQDIEAYTKRNNTVLCKLTDKRTFLLNQLFSYQFSPKDCRSACTAGTTCHPMH